MIEISDGSSVREELIWSILEFWGVARNDTVDVVALEQAAAESSTGLNMSAGQLRELPLSCYS